jgi:hypothetical protein
MAATEVREEEALRVSGRVRPDGPDYELLPFRLAPDSEPF